MPARVNGAAAAAFAAAQVVSTEVSEMKDTKAAKSKMVNADKQTPQQFSSAEVKSISEENSQIQKQTAETCPVSSATVRGKHQSQPDTYVVYPQYQSYVTPPTVHTMSFPGATTMPPGQQNVLQCQTPNSPSFQVAYPPPLNSSEGGSTVTANEFMTQPLQYGWQYHSPGLMSPHQLFPDPYHAFNQFPQTAFGTPYGYTAFQGVPPDPTRQHHRYRNQYQRDPKGSSIACQKGLEYYYSCDCQTKPTRPTFVARKEPEQNTHSASIPSSTTERATANQTRISKSSSDFTKLHANATTDLKKPASDFVQSDSALPSSSLRPTDSVGNRQWYRRENNLSSDSGWISDNSSSNKEDAELVDDTASLSPTINEIGSHFQHSLCFENSTSSSTDESYPETQFSSISSQCPSTSEDSEQQHHVPAKKHQPQPRIMKAIPSRFLNLLHAAAENAAAQRKRLEGYPLFTQAMLQRRYEDHQQQDPMRGHEVQQVEFSLTNQPNQSTSWYFPGSYIQFQYHQNPSSYIQGQHPQGAGVCVQGPYSQGIYTDAQQGPVCYVQGQQGSGGYIQNSYNQGSESFIQSQCNFGYAQPSVAYTCSDQQCGQEYCPTAQTVPVYVIQVDGPDVANSCTMYNDERTYGGCNTQAACEKQPKGYMYYHPNAGYANPVPIQ